MAVQAPISMLNAAGGSKAAAVLALLAGLIVMTALKRAQTANAAAPAPQQRR